MSCFLPQVRYPLLLLPVAHTRCVNPNNRFSVPDRVGGNRIFHTTLNRSNGQNDDKTDKVDGSETKNKPESRSEDEDGKRNEHRHIYTNKYGERIVFNQYRCPPDYVFVPSGNQFITRNCRKLAEKVIAVYRPKSLRRGSAPIGLHVPVDVYDQVEALYGAKQAKIREEISRLIDKRYPKIPSSEKTELLAYIASENSHVTNKSGISLDMVYSFVRDRYTPFLSLLRLSGGKTSKAVTSVHPDVELKLRSWRGEG